MIDDDFFGFQKYGIHHAYPKSIFKYIDTDMIANRRFKMRRIMTPRPAMLAGTMLTGQQWEAIINQIEYEMTNGKLEPMLDVAKDQTRTLHQLGLIGPREFNLLFSWIFDLAAEIRATEGRDE